MKLHKLALNIIWYLHSANFSKYLLASSVRFSIEIIKDFKLGGTSGEKRKGEERGKNVKQKRKCLGQNQKFTQKF